MQDSRQYAQIRRFKQKIIPSGSIRERIWIDLLEMARLYGRDGIPGILRLLRMRMRGEKLMVPAWWLANPKTGGEILSGWDEFIQHQGKAPSPGLVLIYSAVPFQEAEGQRATWLARALLREGFQVIFAYWRWSPNESIRYNKNWTGIYQIPLDELWHHRDKVILSHKESFHRRIFLVEFPHPSLFPLVNLANANGWTTAYDLIDDWQEFRKVGQAAWYDENFEHYLAENVALLTATNPTLVERLTRMTGREVHLVPNACDLDALCLPGEPQALPRGSVTLGYFGHLTPAWYDWGAVVELATRHPDWFFHLIGYGADGHPPIPPNVLLLGKVAHDRIPSYAVNWDLAVIPFKSSELVRAVDPIKVYEYLALGLPVITLGMPHLQRIPSVRNVLSISEFECAVTDIQENPIDTERVHQFLENNTWKKRVEQIAALTEPGRSVYLGEDTGGVCSG